MDLAKFFEGCGNQWRPAQVNIWLEFGKDAPEGSVEAMFYNEMHKALQEGKTKAEEIAKLIGCIYAIHLSDHRKTVNGVVPLPATVKRLVANSTADVLEVIGIYEDGNTILIDLLFDVEY